MTTLALEENPVAVNALLAADHLVVELADGRSRTVPLNWYPRLLHGSKRERVNWQILGAGYAIERPDLGEHIDVECLLAGRWSGESVGSFGRWLGSRSSRP
jgi:hypothetical protein